MSMPAGVQRDYPLARLTTIGTGGPAQWFAQPGTLADLHELLAWAGAEGTGVAVVGLGSNLLVSDEGYPGLALQLAGALAAIEIGEDSAICGGGASLAAVVRRTRDAGLSGIEFGCAIPGTVGGAVRMNAGAYGGELRDVLAEATVVSAAGERRGGPRELEMSYRHSNVAGGEVVAHARLTLVPAPVERIRETVRSMQSRRSESQPRKARTFGSVFKNPPDAPGAGAMIEACGLKGHVVGGARISPVHANFIENVGGARSADVASLILLARARVLQRSGLRLEHEVELLGPIALDD
jgi:UDP-N-acetylenolpyruvoylglucosamine reductase